ncbi:hypothetical protein [Arthrobacter dokdonensis]|uniref:hypothetical protein n=1 Tax=Arthrobacter dokdonellae TaxID=2211210 RepID=UPI001495046C|nr:hypothetical protein [Arthrobacter dokdonellae]
MAALLASGTVAAGGASAAPQEGPTAVAPSSATAAPTASPAGNAPSATTAATDPAPAAPTSAVSSSAPASPTATAPAPSATADPSPTKRATQPAGTLPAGLEAALKRDLGKSVAEFEANGELARGAAAVEAAVGKSDPASVVSVDGDSIKAVTTDAAAARKAAGTAKITVIPEAASPAPGKVDPGGVEALFADYAKVFGAKNLQSIMVDASGRYVIRTGDTAAKPPAPASPPRTATAPAASAARVPTAAPVASAASVADFAAKYRNVVVKPADGHVAAFAGDVVDGQGYASHVSGNEYEACSIGWNGFNRAGRPAVISAGHCTLDGSLKNPLLTDPAHDAAARPPISGIAFLGSLGTFGFSQFGGPGNSPVIGFDPKAPSLAGVGNIGTDVSVIDNITAGLNQLPLATHWMDPANLPAAATRVTGVSTAIPGADICKSGRTTGWTCGTVTGRGLFLVAGVQNPSSVSDVRGVRGFASTLPSDRGDSGAPVISGTTAVGILSAGDGTTTYSTDLVDALAHTGGYTVRIFVNTPTLATPANGTIHRSTTITGRVAAAPAGTTVSATIGGRTVTVPLGANGTWSIKAPNTFGTFKLTARAKSGFSTSALATFNVTIVKQTLAAPAFTAPAANGSAAAPVRTITGTGKPGATIVLSGAVTGTAHVGTNGRWSVAAPKALAPGRYALTARQSLKDWNTSTAATIRFRVVAPVRAAVPLSGGAVTVVEAGVTAAQGSAAGGALAETGVPGTLGGFGAAGGGLLLAGGALLLFRRRDKERPDTEQEH